jgi:presenilin-like A22 family membrane protease
MSLSLFAIGAGALVGIVVAAVAAIVILWAISVYNGLVAARNRGKNAFARLRRRLSCLTIWGNPFRRIRTV